jgi:hypothetical protein
MKKHLTNEKLASYIAGFIDDKERTLISEHLESCEQCRQKHEKISPITNSYIRDKIIPGPELKKRVMESYTKISDEERNKSGLDHFFEGLSIYWKPIIATAAAIIIITIGVFYNTDEYRGIPKSVPMVMRSLKGDVIVDKKTAIEREITIHECSIETGSDSLTEISYSNVFIIKLSGDSLFSIDKAVLSDDAKEMNFRFTLTRGTLISRFTQGDFKVKYSYITPDARIDSTGTEFLLKASKDKTMLIVKEGSVFIRSSHKEEQETSSPDKKYIITDKIVSSPVDSSDQELYNSIDRQYAAVNSKPLGPSKQNKINTDNITAEDSKNVNSNKPDAAIKLHDDKDKIKENERKDLNENRRDNKEMRNDIKQQKKEMKGSRRRGKDSI